MLSSIRDLHSLLSRLRLWDGGSLWGQSVDERIAVSGECTWLS